MIVACVVVLDLIYLEYTEIKNIFEFTIDDFELINYDPHPHIKGIVAV